MIKRSFLLILLILISMSGCSKSDYIEPEKRTVATAIILDYKDNLYSMTIETIGLIKQGDDSPYYPQYIKGNGEDLYQAFKSAQNEISSEISLYHCALIVCNENMFELKKSDLIDFILNTPQISLGADLLLCGDIHGLFLDEENFLGYEIPDAVNLKEAKTNLLDVIRGNNKPFKISVNTDKKLVIREN